MRAYVVLLTFLAYCLFKVSYIAASTANDIPNGETRTPLTKIGDKYYWVEVDQVVNWFEAVHSCRSKGTHLATIESEDEMKALSAYLVSKGYSDWFWASGNDLIMEGDWNWLSTGKKMIFTDWDNGQPDNAFGGEHCLSVWRNGDTFKWNDNSCHNICRYICESRKSEAFSISWSNELSIQR